MPKEVIIGYHPITKNPVNVFYTRETGNMHHMRVVGVAEKWMICDLDNNSKWVDDIMYDHYNDAIYAYP